MYLVQRLILFYQRDVPSSVIKESMFDGESSAFNIVILEYTTTEKSDLKVVSLYVVCCCIDTIEIVRPLFRCQGGNPIMVLIPY
jgi:hypothetical protein